MRAHMVVLWRTETSGAPRESRGTLSSTQHFTVTLEEKRCQDYQSAHAQADKHVKPLHEGDYCSYALLVFLAALLQQLAPSEFVRVRRRRAKLLPMKHGDATCRKGLGLIMQRVVTQTATDAESKIHRRCEEVRWPFGTCIHTAPGRSCMPSSWLINAQGRESSHQT